jgi:glucokinase
MYIGFDLGGTKMLAYLFDQDMNVIASQKLKTGSDRGPGLVAERIIDLTRTILADTNVNERSILGMGIAVPGVIDFDEGVVKQAPNLGMVEFPLARILRQELPFPIYLDNDVNAGTWGEYRRGAGRGYRHVLGVFPGTGIGGGLILDGKLYRGAGGAAGEIGHMIIQPGGTICGCGQEGCLEALASRKAMSKDALGMVAAGVLPAGFEDYGTDLAAYTSSFFLKAETAGIPEIQAITERAARYLGMGIANLVNLLNPECVIIGGGLVEKLGESYRSAVERSMRAHAMAYPGNAAAVVAASLGDDAVPVGAAMLASDSG